MKYSDYVQYMSKIADISYSTAVLSWDKEVYLPKQGDQRRSQQIATLSGIAHELFTKDSFGRDLQRLSEDDSLDRVQLRNVQLTLKDYGKATKFDEEFVINKSRTVSETYQAWILAKEKGDWTIYQPKLEKLIDIVKEESKRYEIGNHPYDSLLDLYEPTMTVEKLDPIFSDVKSQLLPLIKKIKNAKQVNDSFLFVNYDMDEQWQYGLDILKNIGYDFERGRQDLSTHPFTTSFSPSDVRVTTRMKEDNFPMMLWSCIHEGGHALYEQGLPEDQYGLPSGSAISLGIHESQSRLWENNVGRSQDFWYHHFPILKAQFPEQLESVSDRDYYCAMNKIAPNLIRTEADELHYHFHVMIRYELERDLMAGDLQVLDLKERWDDLYEDYLGLRPKNDNEGILQDIHWSFGSIGYFPTYSLGSFYAAQFYKQAELDVPNLSAALRQGDSSSLLNWLHTSIHKHGHSYEAEELCKKLTGKGLDLSAFMEYTTEKYNDIYGLYEIGI